MALSHGPYISASSPLFHLKVLEDHEAVLPLLIVVKELHHPLPLSQAAQHVGLVLHLGVGGWGPGGRVSESVAI